ncbi:MAG: ComEA family DNA-binding protein [Bacillaceae bacterium]|nr:ComEA family DNA-binding protein [Bacillaceae bacterium]
MNWIYDLSQKGKWLLIAAVLLLAGVSTLLYALYGPQSKQNLPLAPYDRETGQETEQENKKSKQAEQLSAAQPDTESGKSEESKEIPRSIFVDIKGAVQSPGVYQLTAGTRVFQAIEKAEGLSDEADVSRVNLAQTLKDGAVVYIPFRKREGVKSGEVPEGSSLIVTEELTPGVNTASTVGSSENGQDTGKININTAGSEELQRLNGVGPKTAAAILDYRQEHGPFQSVEELLQVKGIGAKTLNEWKEQLTVE